MVLSMLVALNACPAMLGTQEAIRQSQSKERREEHRARRCNLVVTCVKPSIRSREINGRQVVLRDGKVYIDTGTSNTTDTSSSPKEEQQRGEEEADGESQPGHHPFAGYFLPYPDSPHEGLVSTITTAAPVLNWLYVDAATHELRYGVRAQAQQLPHLTGPFDCTPLDRRLTLEGWEGFCAVEERPGVWALYFDRDDDGLRARVPVGTRVLEVELVRREKKVTPEVRREALREREVLRLQMEMQRMQKQQQGVQQNPGEEADDELPRTAAAEEDASAADETSGHSGNGSLDAINETDFARLRIDASVDPASFTEHAERTVGTPTDTNCGASLWSAPEGSSNPVRDGSAVLQATPASSVQGDDEVAATEAVFRQHDAVGAPPQPQKYRTPYVEHDGARN